MPTERSLKSSSSARVNKRELAKRASHRTLIRAAQCLFRERGFIAVTIRDLAKAMGMSTGAVFSHYDSKEDVWRASMGCEPPDLEMAVELALLEAVYPAGQWSVSKRPDGTIEAALATLDRERLSVVAPTGADAVRALRSAAAPRT